MYFKGVKRTVLLSDDLDWRKNPQHSWEIHHKVHARGELSDARDSERKIRRMKTGRHLTEEMWVSGGVRTFT